MNRLSKLLVAMLTVAGLTMATEAQAGGGSSHHSSHHHGHHAHHHHNGHHHHHGAWRYRGGRWVYLANVTGPVYNVYYRSGATTPWVLYAPYATADDAQTEAADLQSQGYQAYVQ